LAESVAIDYGWFRPADLKKTFEAIHSIDLPGPIILVGGQSLATWVRYFKMELPPFEGPYLTADADFKGSTKQAEVLATKLDGTVKKPTWDDNTPNTALITLSSETGERITID
jgi:hypothetical protein